MSSVRGWWFPMGEHKAHYFDDERVSLCGRFIYTGDYPLEDDKHESPQNCGMCMKRRAMIAMAEQRRRAIDGSA